MTSYGFRPVKRKLYYLLCALEGIWNIFGGPATNQIEITEKYISLNLLYLNQLQSSMWKKNHTAGNPQPNSVFLGEVESLLCCHRALGWKYTGKERFYYRGSWPAPTGGMRGYLEPQHEKCTSGAEVGHVGRPCDGCLLTETGNQERGVANFVDIHSEWNGSGVSVMLQYFLPMLRHWFPRSPPTPHSDSCNPSLSIWHTLDFKKDGLITNFPNDLRDGFAKLAGKKINPPACFQ